MQTVDQATISAVASDALSIDASGDQAASTALLQHAEQLATAATQAAQAKLAKAEANRAPKPVSAKPAKPVATKPASKPSIAKPSTPAKLDAKPAAKQAEAADKLSQRRAERDAAASAVSDYYSGASLPFKAASDRFADLRLDKPAKKPSVRQAALLAAMLAADTADNIKRNGQFVRGGFRIPARLIDKRAPADAMLAVQPETGCLSDMLGRVVSHVSGPVSGVGQRDAIFRIDFKRARDEITSQLGGAIARAALAKLNALAPPPAAKAAKAVAAA